MAGDIRLSGGYKVLWLRTAGFLGAKKTLWLGTADFLDGKKRCGCGQQTFYVVKSTVAVDSRLSRG